MPIFAMILAMFLLAFPVHAADVSLQPAYDAVLPMIRDTLLSVLAAVVTWVLALIKTKTGLDIEARHREALQSALTKGIDFAIQKVTPERLPDITVRNELLSRALDYVVKAVPDAINHFGLSTDGLRDRLLARLPITTEMSGTAVDASQ